MNKKLFWVVPFLVISILIGIGIRSYNAEKIYFDSHILSNVYYNGEDISGLSFNEVEEIVYQDMAELSQAIIITAVYDDGKSVETSITAEDISLSFNENIIEEIKKANRKKQYDAYEYIKAFLQEDWDKKEFTLTWDFNQDVINQKIQELGNSIEKQPIEATISFDKEPLIIKEEVGYHIDTDIILKQSIDIFTSGETSRSIEVNVETINPKNKQEDFHNFIYINKSDKKLYLYNNKGELVKTYSVAVGTSRYPTPSGDFVIELKRYEPTWVNPAPNGWGSDMPKSIPPGPNNPLGPRALNLNSPGIRIHGTYNYSSIGTAASHGCIRMLPKDVIELYELVEVGSKVFIR